jgi:hypothetical protein
MGRGPGEAGVHPKFKLYTFSAPVRAYTLYRMAQLLQLINNYKLHHVNKTKQPASLFLFDCSCKFLSNCACLALNHQSARAHFSSCPAPLYSSNRPPPGV